MLALNSFARVQLNPVSYTHLTPNDDVKESSANKEKPSNRCKAVPKHKAKEGKPVMGVRIINNTDLSDDEIKEIGCELVDRFSDLLGM